MHRMQKRQKFSKCAKYYRKKHAVKLWNDAQKRTKPFYVHRVSRRGKLLRRAKCLRDEIRAALKLLKPKPKPISAPRRSPRLVVASPMEIIARAKAKIPVRKARATSDRSVAAKRARALDAARKYLSRERRERMFTGDQDMEDIEGQLDPRNWSGGRRKRLCY